MPAMPVSKWWNYTVGTDGHTHTLGQYAADVKRLRNSAHLVFSDQIDMQIIDIQDDQGQLTGHLYHLTEAATAQQLLRAQTRPRVRIVSISAKKSLGPLRITEDLMCDLLTSYKVCPEFLQVILSFGRDAHVLEGGCSNAISHTSATGTRHTSYQLRYPEENNRSTVTPWSLRQTGVHHQSSADFDLWVLLHPTAESVMESQLLALASQGAEPETLRQRVREDPYCLHMMLISSYLGNWRWQLRYLGDDFQSKSDEAFTADLKTAVQDFDSVQALRDAHDDATALISFCKGDLEALKVLSSIEEAHFEKTSSIQSFIQKLEGFSCGFEVLQNRIRNTFDQIAYSLEMKNQSDAVTLNKTLLQLTKHTASDSAAVRTITVVSLLYLPGSFVGTLYGMNFFVFNAETMKINVAHDFWIYVVTWIPLTLLTMAIYALVIVRRNRSQLTSPT